MKKQESGHSLTHLYLYLTDHCNLCCAHCWISPKMSQSRQAGIRLDALKKCIPEAKSLGLQSVKLTGGEPLLYRDLMGLLKLLAAEELSVSIETNGILFDHNILASLQACNVKQISVSLDAAAEEIHDEIRGVEGSFQGILKGLQLLSNADLEFQIIMTLQRRNCNEIQSIIRLSQKFGAGSLKINPLQPCGRAMGAFKRRENLTLDELVQIHRLVKNERSGLENLKIFFDLPLAFLSIDEIIGTGISHCGILNIMGILANGNFSICGIGQTIAELRLGNLYEMPISEVWENNPVLKELRRSIPGKLKGVCHHCIFKFQCLGACRANAYALKKDFYAPYFLCQEYYETGLFPKSRYI